MLWCPRESVAYPDGADGWHPCDVTACALHGVFAVVDVPPRPGAPTDPAAHRLCFNGCVQFTPQCSMGSTSWGPAVQQRTLLALEVWVVVGHLSALPSYVAGSELSKHMLLLSLHCDVLSKRRTWWVALPQTRRSRQRLFRVLDRACASGSSRSCAAEH